ncbi:antioxidant, AhpC/TSA family [Bacteroidales bacterium KA00251]|nr:antioxidant, AhpC/TSA family [Bacteroidales bacterium KA00251]
MENTETKAITMPRIGDKAPAFRAMTTQGIINFPKDFSGKWKILFSHPADFTPVCTTEFMTFTHRAKEFEALNCQLIGLSIDALHSHIAWLRDIQHLEFNGMKNLDVTFPLIEDISMEVAQLYGMIHPNENSTSAVRAVFFIDPDDIIRTILYYPASLGRNFDEILRILKGLQVASEFGVALPADWKPGKDVIVPPPSTCPDAKKRMTSKQEGMTCHDWYLCTKPLSEKEIDKKLNK